MTTAYEIKMRNEKTVEQMLRDFVEQMGQVVGEKEEAIAEARKYRVECVRLQGMSELYDEMKERNVALLLDIEGLKTEIQILRNVVAAT